MNRLERLTAIIIHLESKRFVKAAEFYCSLLQTPYYTILSYLAF